MHDERSKRLKDLYFTLYFTLIENNSQRSMKNSAIMASRVELTKSGRRPNITSWFAQKAKGINMATGGNVPELGGYDYKFTSEVPEDLECLVCHLTLKDPMQIVGCGHRLCKICMESLLR